MNEADEKPLTAEEQAMVALQQALDRDGKRWSKFMCAQAVASIMPQIARELHAEFATIIRQRDELAAALRAAQEELHLIRMKDTASVYNPALWTQIELALASLSTGKEPT